MQHEGNNCSSEFPSCTLSQENLQKTVLNVECVRKNMMEQEMKRKIHCTPCNSPDNYTTAHQRSGSSGRESQKLFLESNKRKVQSSHNERLEKIQKTCPSGKFVNTLIEQWSKYTGNHALLPQIGRMQESPIAEDTRRKHNIDDETIQRLKKKLQVAEKTISSLSASYESELRAKEDILQQLNNDWESITKYYCEISESLKGFQKHKDNLSALYNDVILAQQATVKKLQEDVCTMKLKDEERRNIVIMIENKVIDKEKRIQEMMIAEIKLKKHLEDVENKSTADKNRLHSVYEEEKLELLKVQHAKQEELTLINQDLQMQLQKITEEIQSLTTICAEKDKKIAKEQEETFRCKNKLETLLSENTELTAKYEQSIGRKEELSREIKSKTEEMKKLEEHLIAKQEIQSSLAGDLNAMDIKYKNMQDKLANTENEFKEAQVRNIYLEKTLQEVEINSKQKIIELNRKIELIEKEKEEIVSEKHLKIQELNNLCQIMNEKHEREIISLKREFDVTISETKKTIATQKAALMKLNATMNIRYEENQNRKEDIGTEKARYRLQEGAKEKLPQAVELNIMDMSEKRKYQIETNESFDKSQRLHDPKNENKLKSNIMESNEVINEEKDIYNFNDEEINIEYQHDRDTMKSKFQTGSQTREGAVKNHVTPKNKIFKSRNLGLRQYGTLTKLHCEAFGKSSKK